MFEKIIVSLFDSLPSLSTALIKKAPVLAFVVIVVPEVLGTCNQFTDLFH